MTKIKEAVLEDQATEVAYALYMPAQLANTLGATEGVQQADQQSQSEQHSLSGMVVLMHPFALRVGLTIEVRVLQPVQWQVFRS